MDCQVESQELLGRGAVAFIALYGSKDVLAGWLLDFDAPGILQMQAIVFYRWLFAAERAKDNQLISSFCSIHILYFQYNRRYAALRTLELEVVGQTSHQIKLLRHFHIQIYDDVEFLFGLHHSAQLVEGLSDVLLGSIHLLLDHYP